MNTKAKSSMPSIVSANLRIVGDLVCDGDIQVEGTVEGSVKSSVLTIGDSGTIQGQISADQVMVSGTVVGKIKARTVYLAQSASVTGDILHESLGIEAGAQFEGQCKSLVDGTKSDAGNVKMGGAAASGASDGNAAGPTVAAQPLTSGGSS